MQIKSHDPILFSDKTNHNKIYDFFNEMNVKRNTKRSQWRQ
jgi:hypothetical protein